MSTELFQVSNRNASTRPSDLLGLFGPCSAQLEDQLVRVPWNFRRNLQRSFQREFNVKFNERYLASRLSFVPNSSIISVSRVSHSLFRYLGHTIEQSSETEPPRLLSARAPSKFESEMFRYAAAAPSLRDCFFRMFFMLTARPRRT